jgi:tyrosine-protein phosphatase SIW14
MEKRTMGSTVMEPTEMGKRFVAGRIAPICALLLLFLLLGPPTVPPGFSAAFSNPSSRCVTPGDNPAVLSGIDRVSDRLVSLPGLTSVHRVAPGIFRGCQPEPEGYATLKAMGVRTVINLRTRHGEREAVEGAGMRYVEIPMSFLRKADPAVVRKALSVMTDPANQPVFVHCSVGRDRTGVVVAVYRMEVDGWSKAKAVAEMEALGFHEIWSQLKKTITEWRVGE